MRIFFEGQRVDLEEWKTSLFCRVNDEASSFTRGSPAAYSINQVELD